MTAPDDGLSFGERMKAHHISHLVTCSFCGKEFLTKCYVRIGKHSGGHIGGRFCSNKCKSGFARASSKHDESITNLEVTFK